MKVNSIGVKRAVALAALLCGAAWPVAAQSVFAAIVGSVRDPSGAAVTGAAVKVTNIHQSLQREATTSSQGDYEIRNLPAGFYAISVSSNGFREFHSHGIQLESRQIVRLDVTLQIAELAQEVTVSAAAGVVATETNTISSALTASEVLTLPANFRGARTTSPYLLLYALPGVQADSGNNFSIQGGIPSQANASLDGISTIDVRGNSPLREMYPSIEAIAEMRVQGVGNSAEYGQVGDVTVVSRAGTNRFHGSAFWYHQNRAMDSRPFGAVTKPQKTANTFGGSLGGPLARDRVFFLGAIERMDYRSGSLIQNTVPTTALRGGDFNGEAVDVRDPFNGGAPFAGRTIPRSRLNAAAQEVLRLYPTPNFGPDQRLSVANYRGNRASPDDSLQFDARLDHLLTGRQMVFGRLSWKDIDQVRPNILDLPADSGVNDNRALVAAHNFTITPTLLNEFRAGYTRNERGNQFPFDGEGFAKRLGLRGLGPNYPYKDGMPSIGFGPSPITAFSKGRPATVLSELFQFNNTTTLQRSRHSLKFGIDVRRVRTTDAISFTAGNDYGDFLFTGMFAGDPFADFLLGVPAISGFAKIGPDLDGRSVHWHGFVQDSFRVNSRLTLELGLRYEYHPPFTDAGDNIGNFDRFTPVTGRVLIPSSETARRLLAPGFLQSVNACPGPAIGGVPCTPIAAAREVGYPEGLRERDRNNFNPRFGFAYRPFADSKMAIRGGFGIYTMTQLGAIYYSLTATTSSDVRAFNNGLGTNGMPVFAWPDTQNPASQGVQASSLGAFEFRTANQVDMRDPYAMQWSLSVDRDLGRTTGIRVSHIGMRSVKLPYAPDINQPAPSLQPFRERPLTDRPYPNFSLVYSRDNGANAIYNALQVELSRRFTGGLAFQSAYTWAKNLADNAGPAPSGFAGENGGGRLSNSLDRRADRGNVYGTRQHRWVATLVYELPFGRGKPLASDSGVVANALLGGWRLSSIMLLQSGPWLTPVMSGGDPSGTNGERRGSQRPDRIASGEVAQPSADMWLDRNAFVCPGRTPGTATQFNCNVAPIGRFGNSGVGIVKGPGTVGLNLALAKVIALAEGLKLTLEGAFTNAPNHVNLADPNLNIGSSAFGRITSARSSEAVGNRVGQVSARFDF
jgi:hypothetical protein